MKTLLSLVLLSLPALSFASPYQLKGAYYFKSGDKTPVNFNVRWVEKDGQVTGFYSDDRFAERATVNGMVTDNGRMFEAVLPRENGGVKTLSFLTSSAGAESSGKSIPLQLVARDMTGNPLSTAKFNADFIQVISPDTNSRTAQAEEERPCSDGFGEMAGYCGKYGGMISELKDDNKLCDFMGSKDLRVEVDNEANIIFHTAQPDDRHMSQDHLVGRIPSSTPTRSVDIMSRHCRPLPGTTFPGDDCKTVNLVGTFTNQSGTPHFTGTYTITDEKNDRSCQYSMTLDRVERI